MSREDRFRKAVLFLAITLIYLGGYMLINHWLAQRGIFHDLSLPMEDKIPIVPFFILGYVAYFGIFICVYLRVQNYAFFKRCALAFLICMFIHFWIFVLFPVKFDYRPEIIPQGSIFLYMVDYFYWVDIPYNCFPSLHVSNTFLGLLLMYRYEKGRAWIYYSFAAFVSLSVILVKQHYILDVLAAIPVAYFVNWIAFVGVSRQTTSSGRWKTAR
jgi:membrane-associated phospholipid phosphatase